MLIDSVTLTDLLSLSWMHLWQTRVCSTAALIFTSIWRPTCLWCYGPKRWAEVTAHTVLLWTRGMTSELQRQWCWRHWYCPSPVLGKEPQDLRSFALFLIRCNHWRGTREVIYVPLSLVISWSARFWSSPVSVTQCMLCIFKKCFNRLCNDSGHWLLFIQ